MEMHLYCSKGSIYRAAVAGGARQRSGGPCEASTAYDLFSRSLFSRPTLTSTQIHFYLSYFETLRSSYFSQFDIIYYLHSMFPTYFVNCFINNSDYVSDLLWSDVNKV